MVLEGGECHLIRACRIDSGWDDDAPRVDDVFVPTDEKECEVTGEVIALVPLRNRRTTPDGDQLVARITEAVTRDECAGRMAPA